MNKQIIEEKLVELTHLPESWGPYGGHLITDQALGTARELLAIQMRRPIPEPSIVPCNSGGLQLEWHCGGMDIEIAISSTGVPSIFVEGGEDAFDMIVHEALSSLDWSLHH